MVGTITSNNPAMTILGMEPFVDVEALKRAFAGRSHRSKHRQFDDEGNWIPGRVRINDNSSIRKLMRAARRGMVPAERMRLIQQAMRFAASHPGTHQSPAERARRFDEAVRLSPDLTDLLQRAVAAFNALTPEQQREHMAAQRKSWVVGELMLSNPEMTREAAAAIYDQVVM